MSRDYETFPNDATGDTLWHLSEQGDDLTKVREVEFTVIFAAEEDALKFGEILLFNRQKVLLCDNEESQDYPYEIVVSVSMCPTHQDITEYQALLLEHATPMKGVNDGWGCLVQAHSDQ